MIRKLKNSGFTIIELLVVISIIGLLSSVILVSVSTVRMKARDSARIQSIKQIQNAIELYALNHNGDYPGYLTGESYYMRSSTNIITEGSVNGCGYGASDSDGANNSNYTPGIWCRLESALSPYIPSLPRTYFNGSQYYYYTYKVPVISNANNPNKIKTYGLSVKLEQANSLSQNDGGYYPDQFEVGELPVYCKNNSSNDPGSKNWSAWSNVPCSCGSTSCGY